MVISLISAGAKAEAGGLLFAMFDYDSIVQGTWAYDSMAYGYGRFRNTTGANADEVTYKEYLTAGTYKIFAVGLKASSMAIVSIKIDSVEVLRQDMYNAVNVDGFVYDDTFVIGSSGIKTISIKADGKHASSSSYSVFLYGLSIRRVA